MTSDDAFRIISVIAEARGQTKQVLLHLNPNVSKYLRAAYDPYTRYYITKCAKGEGDQEFNYITWEILEQLSTRKLSGYNAQMTVDSITAGMTPKSAELFQRILKKDMRMGMGVKSINKALPGLIQTHDVMLAKPKFESHRLRFPCFGSPKVDGVRSKFKNGIFYSRNGHPYVGLEHLQKELSNITEEVDGELVVPGVSFQVGSGWIRSDDPTPDAEFRIIELPTIKENLITRLTMMSDLHLIGDHITYISREVLNSIDDVYRYYKTCRNAGYEGCVITPYDYEYVGSRSWNWMKMKPLGTYDTKVLDIYEGKGKYKDQMGGVVVMFKGKPNKVGGGWSDIQRKGYWEKPELIIGRMIEVHYMEETDDGNMRHSRFFDFRTDKEE